eukprot:10604992-Heterocapsa_arctica.AAC.1
MCHVWFHTAFVGLGLGAPGAPGSSSAAAAPPGDEDDDVVLRFAKDPFPSQCIHKFHRDR